MYDLESKVITMLSEAEKNQLSIYRGMATMNNSQALEFHELLMKELAVAEAVKKIEKEQAVFVAEAKPKKRKK
jgi:hypothetical protein